MHQHNPDPSVSSTSTGGPLFADAYGAGELLGRHLASLPHIRKLDHSTTVLVGVTEGGLPLAYMASAALPMRVEPAPVASVRAPFQRDIRVGMLVDDGTLYLEAHLGLEHGASGSTLDHLTDRADESLAALMRDIGDKPGATVAGCDVIVVDDVIETGMTTVACVDWLRRWGAREIHMAAAVATQHGLERAREVADSVTVLTVLDHGQLPRDVFATNVAPSMRHVVNLAAAMQSLNYHRGEPIAQTGSIDTQPGTGLPLTHLRSAVDRIAQQPPR